MAEAPPEDNQLDGSIIRSNVRERVPTDKGLQYAKDVGEKNFRTSVSKWRSCANTLHVRMSDSEKVDCIRESRSDLERFFSDVTITYRRLSELFSSDDSVPDRHVKVFDEIERDHQTVMCKVSDRILEFESEQQALFSVTSKSSKSGRSRRSAASVISKRSDAVAEVAALKAKLKYIDAESKAKMQLDKVVMQRKIEMAQAKANALDSSVELSDSEHPKDLDLPELTQQERVEGYLQYHTKDDNGPSMNAQEIKPKMEHDSYGANFNISMGLNPNADAFSPAAADQNARVMNAVPAASPVTTLPVDSGILELTKSLAEQLTLNRLPPPEPGIFNGDPLKYPGWKSAFQTLIEQKSIPPPEKIHYLQKYLNHEVREVVSNYFLIGTEDAYKEAKDLLDQRYGDRFVIASAFRDKLDRWPKIQSRDGYGLRRFSDFLKQCNTAMESVGSLSVLNDEQENRKLLAKLPEWIVSRWNRHAVSWKVEHKAFPPFYEFMTFISKEAKIACDPITSLQSLKTEQGSSKFEKVGSKVRGDRESSRRVGSFLSEAKANPSNLSKSVDKPVKKESSLSESGDKPVKKECAYCQRNHFINTCKGFLSQSMEDRKLFARQKGLCFGCLKIDHIARFCQQRERCAICSNLHPTAFHGDRVNEAGNTRNARSAENQKNGNEKKSADKTLATSGATLLSCGRSGHMSAMILPVYVSHEEHPDRELLVYALLDSQSDTTFVHEDVREALGIKGVDVELLLSTMYAENRSVSSQKVKGLTVRGYNSDLLLSLPDSYTRQIIPVNRSHIPTQEMAQRWPHLQQISQEIPPLLSCEIGLLIGYNCPKALLPRDVISSESDGPFAQRTDLGWSIVGFVDHDCDCDEISDPIGVSHRVVACEVDSSLSSKSDFEVDNVVVSFQNKVKETFHPSDVVRMMNLDFVENQSSDACLSVEDKRFLKIVGDGIEKKDTHYEMPLPLKSGNIVLPPNKTVATKRLNYLRRRLKRDQRFCNDYCTFMKDMISRGYAEKVPQSGLDRSDGKVWYIPHHGIYNPKKPEKIRVVFDCSAQYNGESLNKHLLQGPDLTNTLVGVLCRFRCEKVAILCDIEQMFFQFRVAPDNRDLLRFLWWESENFDDDPVEYRMCVHLFGATSSPGCANFGLKQIAKDNEAEFGETVANFIRRDFYVDDGLTSKSSEKEAMNLITQSKDMLSRGGIRLHKFLSNSKTILQQLPSEDIAKSFVDIDLLSDSLPIERALGVYWSLESDSFQFRITLSDKPLTKRGILSTVNSIYDPLGFISPVVLLGKQILQLLCADHLDWDSPVPEAIRFKWEKWRSDLLNLSSVEVNRCFKPDDFGPVTTTEVHHFSDASQNGYGQCSYLRLVDSRQRVCCSLIMGKSRVAPLKPITIPRLELTAAVVSVKLGSVIEKELDLSDVQHWYWTDSKIVLGYVANEARRFHVFVANRVQQIRERTTPSQWKYVKTGENPADIASRGVTVDDLVKGCWFKGPEFLWETVVPNLEQELPKLPIDDCELKKSEVLSSHAVQVEKFNLMSRLEYFSSWSHMKNALATCLCYIETLKRRVQEKSQKSIGHSKKPQDVTKESVIQIDDLKQAEILIIKSVQSSAFKEEIDILKDVQRDSSESECEKVSKSALRKRSAIARLDPFLDNDGILRVGGRLTLSKFQENFKNPVILPHDGNVVSLIIQHFHQTVNHQGRGMTMNEVRANGYWIIGLSSAVYRVISQCTTCRRLRSAVRSQKMADLPSDRLEAVPPFTYSGVDCFGPWIIREGRKELKRYGVLFTCLCCRAIHIEVAASLTTDSFINALRRFISIRGPVRELRSDRGTNFVGAERELSKAVAEMDHLKLNKFLLENGCDSFLFKMNPPSASHMGGVWERQIRSVRSILSYLLYHHGSQLDDESLRTFMCEASAIVNSRPLTTQNLNDPRSTEPLTPNHLLTMKSKLILPPPGQFSKVDLYSRKRWRRIQYLANEFWSRWRTEYLQNLQVRQKWERTSRNFQVGDVVLITDENLPRNQWSLAKVVETEASVDGLVRKVKLLRGTSSLDERGRRSESPSYLYRPIHKLVLILETEESPVKEP